MESLETNPSEERVLLKRTHVYVQHPRLYEISGCPANPQHEVTWSEYEKHLWCFACEKDFIAEHGGIFDGPIPVGAASLMGISFDRVNIESGEITKFSTDEDFDWDAYNSTWNRGENEKALEP